MAAGVQGRLGAALAAISILGLPGTWLVIALAAAVDLVELLWRADDPPPAIPMEKLEFTEIFLFSTSKKHQNKSNN